MRQNLVRNVLFGAIALLLLGASLLAIDGGVHADANQRITVNSQVVPLVRQAHLVQTTDVNQLLNLSIGLQVRNQAGLNNLLSDIYNPASTRYHHYLTPDEFNQLFAPTPAQVQQVVAFLHSQGFTVTNIASNGLVIDASGTVGQAQQAFAIQINNYQLKDFTFYSNATPPSVPASISALVTSVNGLDNSVTYHPLYQHLLASSPLVRHWKRPGPVIPIRPIKSLPLNLAPTGFGPKDLSSAYDSTPLQNANTLGDNQTIALFELDGYQLSDLAQYFQYYNLSIPNITNVLVDGVPGVAGQGAIEVELDMEVAAGIAPHANQIVYEGPNTIQGINDTYNKIVTDNKAQMVSISWGLCEASASPTELQTLDTIFKQGAAEGISFFAASGDSGAYDCGDSNLAVDSPADDPYVTGVGGTSLQLNAGAYSSESVWSNPNDTHRSPKGAGSGGGLSSTFALPQWQSGPGVNNQFSNGKREVPDVTADADPATGYAVYCTVLNAGCPATGWLTVGGTSAAAPLWASNMALVNQYLQAQGKARIGYANPALYAIYNNGQPYPAFHDVTAGNNLFYQATANYDLASGLGSPDVYNLARDLVASSGGNTGGGTPTPIPTPTNTPPPTPTPAPPPPALIQNSGFENGQNPWQESSSGGYQIVDPSNPHTGTYSAYLCGYIGCNDRIGQTFTVPANYNKVTVTYWWYSDTNKTVKLCLDNFSSQVQTTTGATIQLMQQSCNLNATNAWVQESFDVSRNLQSYKGKQVSLFFFGTNAPGLYQTSDFFVDDVVVNVA